MPSSVLASEHRHLKPLPVFALLLSLAACRDPQPAATNPLPEPVSAYPPRPASESPAKGTASRAADDVIWERLGAWTGKGSIQTESFTGETGAFRIKWETKAVAGQPEGSFLLTIHSAISGRPLQVAVDQRGPGADTAFINEDPRVFFAVIEAKDIEWSFSVEEALGARTVNSPKP